MEKAELKKHGVFSWNELMTTDVAAAKAFYKDLLGWTLQDINPNGMDYTIAKAGSRETGGIMGMPEGSNGMPPSWGSYVSVDNVDSIVSKVKKLGGKICVDPRDIPDVGRFAVIQDPQGAMLSLITYSENHKH